MNMVNNWEKQHLCSCMVTHLKRSVLLLLTTLLVACGNKTESEVEYVPVSTQDEVCTNDELRVTGIGQSTGFNKNGDTIELYPYFDIDKKVTLRKISISNNNFWYDFVVSQGYTMADVKLYKTGIMVLPTQTASYGYLCIDDSTAVFAYTSDLPWSYVNLALEHSEVL